MKALPAPANDNQDSSLQDFATINGVHVDIFFPEVTPTTELCVSIHEMAEDDHGFDMANLDVEHLSDRNRFTVKFEAATKQRALKFLADLTTVIQAMPEVGIPMPEDHELTPEDDHATDGTEVLSTYREEGPR